MSTPINVSDYRVSSRSSRAVPRGYAAADAAPALSVRGRLPRAGKWPPLILSLRSRPRRVRDAVRRQMRCGRCAWGGPRSTDRWARTRRVESLRPFSRARVSGGRRAWLAPDVLGRPRPALRDRQPGKVIIDCEPRSQTADRAAHVQRRAWLRPLTAVGARRRTAKPERDRSRFLAATSYRAIHGVRRTLVHRALRHLSSGPSPSRRGSGRVRAQGAFPACGVGGRRPEPGPCCQAAPATIAVTPGRCRAAQRVARYHIPSNFQPPTHKERALTQGSDQ